MTAERNALAKGAVNVLDKRRLIVTAYQEGTRSLVELRAREEAGRRVNVVPFCDLTVGQAKELRRLLDLAIAAAETIPSPDKASSRAAGRGPAVEALRNGEAVTSR